MDSGIGVKDPGLGTEILGLISIDMDLALMDLGACVKVSSLALIDPSFGV